VKTHQVTLNCSKCAPARSVRSFAENRTYNGAIERSALGYSHFMAAIFPASHVHKCIDPLNLVLRRTAEGGRVCGRRAEFTVNRVEFLRCAPVPVQDFGGDPFRPTVYIQFILHAVGPDPTSWPCTRCLVNKRSSNVADACAGIKWT